VQARRTYTEYSEMRVLKEIMLLATLGLLSVPLLCKVKLQETTIKELKHVTSSRETSDHKTRYKETDKGSRLNMKESLNVRERRSVNHFQYFQEISKCCPNGFILDEWYKCVKNINVVPDMFINELLEVGAKDKDKYVISQGRDWEKCPVGNRKEFEVLHIPHDKNKTVYVFVDVDINYDITDNNEIDFDGFKEMKYSCLELSNDVHSITALICEERREAEEKDSFIRKCCPKGQGLARNFSSCTDIDHHWIPPRAVLHHKTEKMTGSYKLISGHGLCSDDEISIVETADAVTTGGLFIDSSYVPDPQAYHCVDTLFKDKGTWEKNTEDELVALICLKKGCESNFCVSKCCLDNEIFVQTENLCAPIKEMDHAWTHVNTFWHVPHQLQHTEVEYNNHFLENFRKYPNRIPNCDKAIILDNSYNYTHFILPNGSFYHQDHGLTNAFCVDNTLDKIGSVSEIVIMCVNSSYEDILDKADNTKSCLGDYENILRMVNTVSGSISCLFLAITFLVYTLVPQLDNLHGKIVLSNVFTIFFLTVYLLLIYNIFHFPATLCIIIGYIGYFLTMSMFFWMTIMSFDLCWTFIRAKVPNKGSAAFKFSIYSSVAWGSSAGLTILVFLADQMTENDDDYLKFFFPKPNIGETKCFLQDESQGFYLHLPILLLMILNGLFFIITIITLYR
jgi:hypothetical protein